MEDAARLGLVTEDRPVVCKPSKAVSSCSPFGLCIAFHRVKLLLQQCLRVGTSNLRSSPVLLADKHFDLQSSSRQLSVLNCSAKNSTAVSADWIEGARLFLFFMQAFQVALQAAQCSPETTLFLDDSKGMWKEQPQWASTLSWWVP